MTGIAVLSAAHAHAAHWLRAAAKRTDDVRIELLWDEDRVRGERLAAECGLRFVPRLDVALDDPRVDGFAIGSDNASHAALLEQAIPRGKPVLCEKPLVLRIEDARTVTALLARHRTALIDGFVFPRLGEYRAVRAALGSLGTVSSARAAVFHGLALTGFFDAGGDFAWFADPPRSGGGALVDVGVHAVHLLRWLLGPVRRVWAQTPNRRGRYAEVDDDALALLDFGGCTATVEASWIRPAGRRMLELYGDRGAIQPRGEGFELHPAGGDAQALAPVPTLPSGIDALVAAIRGEDDAAERAACLDAALDAVAIMDAAMRSAASGRWEDVAAIRAATAAV